MLALSCAATLRQGQKQVNVEHKAGPAPAPAALDTSGLSDSARKELQTVLADEFCSCGCPHSLDSCIKEHANCRHARRTAALAATFAQDGVAGVEIINVLSKYYRSFREPRHTFEIDPRMCKGGADAQVTLVEFSDFECPFCANARLLFDFFIARHGAMVRFCYANFPLASHPNAVLAAQAALFARDQGKFWPMHDLLFDNQADLNKPVLKKLAESLKLSGAELEKVWAENRYVDEINASKEAGKAASVTGTPAVFVNGRAFNTQLFGLSEQMLAHTVDDELEWIAGKNAWIPD